MRGRFGFSRHGRRCPRCRSSSRTLPCRGVEDDQQFRRAVVAADFFSLRKGARGPAEPSRPQHPAMETCHRWRRRVSRWMASPCATPSINGPGLAHAPVPADSQAGEGGDEHSETECAHRDRCQRRLASRLAGRFLEGVAQLIGGFVAFLAGHPPKRFASSRCLVYFSRGCSPARAEAAARPTATPIMPMVFITRTVPSALRFTLMLRPAMNRFGTLRE